MIPQLIFVLSIAVVTCILQLDDFNNVDKSPSGRLSRRTKKGDKRKTACSGKCLANDRQVSQNVAKVISAQ